MRALRVVLRVLKGFGIGFGLVLLATPLIVASGKVRAFTVMSGSMEPVLGVGDVVIERTIQARDMEVGDVVSFLDPDDDSRLITHRIRNLEPTENGIEVVTKGDSNNTTERWSIAPDGTLGKVMVRIPMLGHAMHRLGGPLPRVLLIAVPALFWGLLELRRIWRSPAGEEVPDGAPA